ncbi:phage tail tape measure protein [Rhizobium tumorigenes]|uniref:phage tail tape measure protein n=1 Tax=Rhizobium tumorigenes TaxID=2041385 RepID=UPI00241DC7DF|nr:phage tail tape measure protein [Rhizobium tumorigenes]WFS02763.1 phage tail tape measure protein [Rhizobium tumorigenes]
MAGIVGKLVAFGGAYVGVSAAINGAFKPAMEFQAALTEIAIKADLSTGATAQLKANLLKLAPATNQTVEALTKGLDVMVGMGLATSDAAAALPAIGRAATATGASLDDLAGSAVSAIQNLKITPSEVNAALNGMAAAGNAGAFELKDMAQYFPQLTASAQSLGMHGVGAVNDLAAALQIARRGAGDASTAANNTSDFLSKVNNPQTVKNLKKMGVDVQKVLANASKKGISPIEAMIKVIDKATKGGKNELLTQVFGDKQALDFTRSMIAGYGDYLKIRDQANNGGGTIDKAFSQRMDNAQEKLKGFKIRMDELGLSLGDRLLGPAGDAAKKLTEILDSLDQRPDPVSQITTAASGFMNGLGVGGKGSFADQMADFLLGPADASKAADRMGQVFGKFQGWGKDVKYLWDQIKDNALVKFIEDLAPTAGKWTAVAAGISLAATAISALASALLSLTGIKAATRVLGGLAGLAGGGAAVAGGGGTAAAGGGVIATLLKKGPLAAAAYLSLSGNVPEDPQGAQKLENELARIRQRDAAKRKARETDKYTGTDGQLTAQRGNNYSLIDSAVDGANSPSRLPARSNGGPHPLTAINDAIDRASRVGPKPIASMSSMDMLRRLLFGDGKPDVNSQAVDPIGYTPPAGKSAKSDGLFNGMTYDSKGFHTAPTPTVEPINAASIASAIGGTQLSVKVTNPQPAPNINISAPITINEASNPKATATAMQHLGGLLNSARQSAFTDMN